jgi:PAS domain S-box-containing protein
MSEEHNKLKSLALENVEARKAQIGSKSETEKKQQDVPEFYSPQILEYFVQHSLDAIIIHNSKKLLMANRSAMDLFGVKDFSEVASAKLLDFVAPEYRDIVISRISHSLQQQEITPIIEEKLLRLDGSTVIVEVYTIPLKYHGQNAVMVVMKDVTEQRQLSEQIKAAKESAEKANLAKTEFLAKMSHELRTPLNGVIGSIDLLFYTDLSTEQLMLLNQAYTSAETLKSEIQDLLDITRIEAGQLPLDCTPFDVEQMLENIVKMFKSVAEHKGLKLGLHYTTSVPHLIIGDPIRLWQIITNLLSNAVKFTERGEINIGVWSENITVSEQTLLLAVQDTGIGIPENELDNIFNNFYQLHYIGSSFPSGPGLGLAICKQLVNMMGGDIKVESRMGVGTTFTVKIKFARPNMEEILQAFKSGRFWLSTTLPAVYRDVSFSTRKQIELEEREKPLILLAEDNAVNQKLLTSMLQKNNCRVDVAMNGKEAVKMAGTYRYNMILMDCQMPLMDGFKATELIRKNANSKSHDSIIIAITAFAMPGDRERCLNVGMDDYLCKPIRSKELINLLDKWLPPPKKIETPN